MTNEQEILIKNLYDEFKGSYYSKIYLKKYSSYEELLKNTEILKDFFIDSIDVMNKDWKSCSNFYEGARQFGFFNDKDFLKDLLKLDNGSFKYLKDDFLCKFSEQELLKIAPPIVEFFDKNKRDIFFNSDNFKKIILDTTFITVSSKQFSDFKINFREADGSPENIIGTDVKKPWAGLWGAFNFKDWEDAGVGGLPCDLNKGKYATQFKLPDNAKIFFVDEKNTSNLNDDMLKEYDVLVELKGRSPYDIPSICVLNRDTFENLRIQDEFYIKKGFVSANLTDESRAAFKEKEKIIDYSFIVSEEIKKEIEEELNKTAKEDIVFLYDKWSKITKGNLNESLFIQKCDKQLIPYLYERFPEYKRNDLNICLECIDKIDSSSIFSFYEQLEGPVQKNKNIAVMCMDKCNSFYEFYNLLHPIQTKLADDMDFVKDLFIESFNRIDNLTKIDNLESLMFLSMTNHKISNDKEFVNFLFDKINNTDFDFINDYGGVLNKKYNEFEEILDDNFSSFILRKQQYNQYLAEGKFWGKFIDWIKDDGFLSLYDKIDNPSILEAAGDCYKYRRDFLNDLFEKHPEDILFITKGIKEDWFIKLYETFSDDLKIQLYDKFKIEISYLEKYDDDAIYKKDRILENFSREVVTELYKKTEDNDLIENMNRSFCKFENTEFLINLAMERFVENPKTTRAAHNIYENIYGHFADDYKGENFYRISIQMKLEESPEFMFMMEKENENLKELETKSDVGDKNSIDDGAKV